MHLLAKAGVGVLDNAPLAVLLDRPVALDRYLAILDVELLQPSAVVSDALYPSIGDHITVPEAELLQVGAALG